jgi:glyoxylase-like metal-dependent hydrolase (beta-lactamase superfamily II)
MSYHNPDEGIIVVGDATGLFDPVRDVFWPNYFYSLEAYCNSIRKLAALPATTGVLCHHYILGDIRHHFQKAMNATELYHEKVLSRLNKGDDPDKVALEIAKWTYTFTNLQTFQIILEMNRLMMKRSQTTGAVKDMFKFPD